MRPIRAAAMSIFVLMMLAACAAPTPTDTVFQGPIDTAVQGTVEALSSRTAVALALSSTATAEPTHASSATPSLAPTLTVETPGPSDTPVPTPLPSLASQVVFTLYRHSFSVCGSERVSFIVFNNGSTTFESSKVQIRDITANNNIYGPVTDSQPFGDNPTSCPRDKGSDSLSPGATAYLVIPMRDFKAGNQAAAYVTLCTRDDARGSCVTRGAYFRLP